MDIVFSYQESGSTLTTNLSFIDTPRVMLNGPGTYVPIR